MSKIGTANLDLQEQAERLGFESVQEALDNGYTAVYSKDGEFSLMKEVDRELMKAHEKWLARKKFIIDELTMLLHDTPNEGAKQVIKDAIDFIKEGEV